MPVPKNTYQHDNRVFGRDSASSLPLVGYRVRLLGRCLKYHDQLIGVIVKSFPTSSTVTAPTANSTAPYGDVGDLLEFLQHDAVPYEVTAPPYVQIPGGARRKPTKPGGTGIDNRTSPYSKASGTAHIKAQRDGKWKSTKAQNSDLVRTAPTGTQTSKSPTTDGVPSEGMPAAAAITAASPTLSVSRKLSAASSPPSTNPVLMAGPTSHSQPAPAADELPLAVPATRRVHAAAPQASPGPLAIGPSMTTSLPGSVAFLSLERYPGDETHVQPTRGTGGNGTTAPPKGTKRTPDGQTRLTATGGSPSSEGALQAVPTACVPTAASSLAGVSATRARVIVDGDRTHNSNNRETVVCSTYDGGGQAAAGYLDGRRASVLWQWKQFLGNREGPQEASVGAAAEASDPWVTAEGTSVPAPSASAASTRPGGINKAASAVAGSSPQNTSSRREWPAVKVLVPGIVPPPPRDLPNAATGAAADDRAAAAATAVAADAAEPVSPAARVPAVLLPLTVQGRILLMDAALKAAEAAAVAACRFPKAARRVPLEDSGRRATADCMPTAAITQVNATGVTLGCSTAAAVVSADSTNAAAAAVAAIAAPKVPAAAPRARIDGAGEAATAVPVAVDGDSRTLSAVPSTATGGVTSVESESGKDPRRQRAVARLAAAAAATVTALPPGVPAARELLAKLARYIPASREDGPAVLAPYVRYQYDRYQEAAAAAAAHPGLLLWPLGLQQLSYIAAAYAAGGHRHEIFLRALTAAAVEKMAAAAARRRAWRGDPVGAGAAPSGATPSAEAPLTFRTACVMLTALARLRYRDAALTAALGRWLAAALRSGDVTPRAKWKGTWLAAALWSYATLERLTSCDDSNGGGGSTARAASTDAAVALPPPPALADVTAAGAVMFTEAAEAIRVDPGWIHLMDCREALWALWALKVAAAVYGGRMEVGAGVAAAGMAGAGVTAAAAAGAAASRGVSYTPQPLVELQLLERAASQLDQLDPGHLAEAYVVAAEAGLGADRDMLAALRRCTLARIAAIRPQPLSVMVSSLALLQVHDVTWLSALAAACRNQMVNMQPEQMVIVLHGFAVVLRFYYLPLFHAAAVMCTLPGYARLAALPAGDVVRLAAAYAAVGHYEAILQRQMAERIMTLGSSATPWQRASVLHSCTRLSYRSNGLLRAMAAEAFSLSPPPSAVAAAAAVAVAMPGLPTAQLAAVAAACGHLQFRPPGLLKALHATRTAEWARLNLRQRAQLCWSILVLTGGLAACRRSSGGGAGQQDLQRRLAGAEPPIALIQDDRQQQERQQQLQWRPRRQEQQLLAEALCAYLRTLASTDWRVWPASIHHTQLLVACSVIAWQEQQRQEQQQTERQQQAETQQLGGGGGGGSWIAGDAALAGHSGGGGSEITILDPGVSPRMGMALLSGMQRLPAAATQRTLAMHHRLRQGALGPWARQVADVVRQVIAGAAAADTAADTAAVDGGEAAPPPPRSRLWLGNPGRRSDAAAVTPAIRLVRGGTVTEGLLCASALTVDLCVDVELEAVEEVVPFPPESTNSLPGAFSPVAESRTAAAGSCDRNGDGQLTCSAVRQRWRRRQQKVRIALELCAPQPPGAAGAAASVGGGGVVRNSRWLLSGTAALRRRLLVGLGWVVVVVRERTWQRLRSPNQRLRAMEAMLRRAVLQAVDEAVVAAEAAAVAGLDEGDAAAVAGVDEGDAAAAEAGDKEEEDGA